MQNNELITKSEVINLLCKLHIDNVAVNGKRITEYVKELPCSCDVKKVVRGKWVDTQPGYHNGYYKNARKCSNCNDYYTTEYEDLHFCPRCGAEMNSEKE